MHTHMQYQLNALFAMKVYWKTAKYNAFACQ